MVYIQKSPADVAGSRQQCYIQQLSVIWCCDILPRLPFGALALHCVLYITVCIDPSTPVNEFTKMKLIDICTNKFNRVSFVLKFYSSVYFKKLYDEKKKITEKKLSWKIVKESITDEVWYCIPYASLTFGFIKSSWT